MYDWLIAYLFCTDVVAAAVLSGNRNFEGRVHPLTRANYLASPPLVVAYALAGTVSSYLLPHNLFVGMTGMLNKHQYICVSSFGDVINIRSWTFQVDIDFEKEPIGVGKDGKEVYFRDIWPSTEEIAQVYSVLKLCCLSVAMYHLLISEMFMSPLSCSYNCY